MQGREWQLIKTAPKDCEFLGWNYVRGFHLYCWHEDAYAKRPQPHWHSYAYPWGILDMRANQPTHWMPLPDPPVAVREEPAR